jgi:outer membrane protein
MPILLPLLAVSLGDPIIVTLPARPMSERVTLSPTEMFAVAEAAQRRGDIATAERLYRSLTADRSLELRNEARFRLATLYVREHRYKDAGILFRQILDEQPNAQRVRLELANVLALLGDDASARRELRAARAGDLPTEVAAMVDRFSAALRSRKPVGGSVQIGVASDTNINRATRSDTLGTVIGDFILNEDAKAHSGLGLSFDGQGFGRVPVGTAASILLTLSGAGDLYRQKRFDDITIAARAGPEFSLAKNRLNVSLGLARRWYADQLYTSAVGGRVDVTRPLSGVAQLRVSATGDKVRNYVNRLESGWVYSGSAILEHALSARAGAGLAVSAGRRSLRDPGYSTTSGEITGFAYREAGRTTMTGSLSLGHLAADKRLLLFPEKRSEWLVRGTVGATFRQATVHGFAPTVQLTLERNRSTIELYDYRRAALEIGIIRAF